MDAKPVGRLCLSDKIRRVDQHFRWDTALGQAGAAKLGFFDNRTAQPFVQGSFHHHQTGAAAHNNHIEMLQENSSFAL
ncbi:hypothetical protein SDC9_190406 [bioreactor metagenome]|uniref:Uncharacterized protein n=1 Tax=bioreactor metagenome TaxID=1076179 RepID=A0A645HUZ7_9ZZZZ